MRCQSSIVDRSLLLTFHSAFMSCIGDFNPQSPHKQGPALLAFTLMMTALSLRIWRRNGVACDELIFLPGTQHGQNNGIDAPLVETPVPSSSSPSARAGTSSSPGSSALRSPMASLVASFPRPLPLSPSSSTSPSQSRRQMQLEQQQQQQPLEADAAAGGGVASSTLFRHRRSHSDDMELVNIAAADTSAARRGNESSSASNNNDSAERNNHHDQDHDVSSSSLGSHHGNGLVNRANSLDPGVEYDSDTEALLVNGSPNTNTNTNATSDQDQQQPNAMQRFRENHPQITRIGNFFFFRSSSTTTENAAYAPSGPSVFGAGLDMSMPILFNFHIFIEAYNHRATQGEATAKILPLIFLSVLIVRTSVPPSRRGRFWSTMKFTFTAPLHPVSCRDEYIGDVLTSLVRPCQDVFFALAYYVTVIYGMVSGNYGLDRSGQLLEESLLLHNIILPTCAILPLWWKYLQTLRQAYDSNKRWPHQANSLKYLFSTVVIIYGMTHSEDLRSPWWIVCFTLTVIYQVWWDIVMDWDLFHIQREVVIDASTTTSNSNNTDDSWFEAISSIRPNSTILLWLQLYIVQPTLGFIQRIPHWKQIQLREKRLYKTEAFYWKICIFNVLMRFTWMLCFIPAYHFSSHTKYVTASSDTNSYFGVLLPVAEIVRRACWGFLYMEKETIRMMDSDSIYSRIHSSDDNDDEENMDDNSKDEMKSFRMPTWLDVQQQVAHDAATNTKQNDDRMMHYLFVFELCVWAVAFIGFGCWSAY
mmetsp:Transcript_7401/g.21688  ORF Transcript_7401/g.21688 Transcript_7401/m.21688 type:complete len:758 (+) Transcript_7401:727-3000(+)